MKATISATLLILLGAPDKAADHKLEMYAAGQPVPAQALALHTAYAAGGFGKRGLHDHLKPGRTAEQNALSNSRKSKTAIDFSRRNGRAVQNSMLEEVADYPAGKP